MKKLALVALVLSAVALPAFAQSKYIKDSNLNLTATETTAQAAPARETSAPTAEPVCRDASGATIACPAEPATTVPGPTELTAAGGGGTSGEQDWKGTCSSKNKFHGVCLLALKNACTGQKGTPSTAVESNGDFTVSCSVPD